MQPLDITERLKASYKSYIKTAFPVIESKLRADLHGLLDQGNLLWRGPYLSLQRPYETSYQSLSERQSEWGFQNALLAAGEFVDDKG